ncbi:MAG TPA: hypothetical protein PK306_26440 [Aquabacterium sp.]|nr:hypothetical protein [Aquabacterium sp.]
MKVADFIEEFRGTVEDNAEPFFWSSENIVRYLNEAVQEACERAKLIEDRSTPSVCSLSIEAGVSTYNLHPSVLEIKRLTLNGQKLDETSEEELDEDCPGGSCSPANLHASSSSKRPAFSHRVCDSSARQCLLALSH